MCGLVGIAGDTTHTWKDLFGNLLVVDSLRGTHSTGVAIVERFEDKIAMAKEVGHPFNLMWSQQYADLMKKSAKVMIGHNRYATLGKHVVENAHPFAFENVVGAHNGTLDRWTIKDLHDSHLYDTDSQAIYASIEKHGIEWTTKRLQGAWALTWYDKRDNTLNMLRNNRRPLFYGYSEDRCTLMWASELDMLKLVIGRSYKKVKEEDWHVVSPDTHLSWEVPQSIIGKFEPPKMVERKGKEPAPVVYHYGGPHGQVNWFNGEDQNYINDKDKNKDKKSGVVAFLDDYRRRKDTKKFRPPYKDCHGKVINKQHFEEYVSNGCVFCGDNNINWGAFIQPLRTVGDAKAFLCAECYNDDEIFDICGNVI